MLTIGNKYKVGLFVGVLMRIEGDTLIMWAGDRNYRVDVDADTVITEVHENDGRGRRCGKCGNYKPPNKFREMSNGKLTKVCIVCLDKLTAYQNNFRRKHSDLKYEWQSPDGKTGIANGIEEMGKVIGLKPRTISDRFVVRRTTSITWMQGKSKGWVITILDV